MACSNMKPRFFKVGSYYLREDKIIGLVENPESKGGEKSITIYYDTPNLRSIQHKTPNPTEDILSMISMFTEIGTGTIVKNS